MIFLLICFLVTVLYFYFTRTYDYWAKRGLKYAKPVPVFGNYLDNILGKKSITQLYTDIYRTYPDEKAVGCFRLSQPTLLVRDPDIIKRVWTTDFNCFHARGIDEIDDDIHNMEVLRRQLIVVEGDLWRVLRSSCSPAFTSSKLRAMFPLVEERAERLRERTRAVAGHTVDARDHMARYTTDFIGACGMGVDSDALTNEDSAFRKLSVKIYTCGFKDLAIIIAKTLLPRIFKRVRYFERFDKDFCDLVNEILKKRNYKPSGRHDFIDFMLEIKAKGDMECDSMERTKPDGTPERVRVELDDALVAAQVFAFFAAGFETSSSASSYTLHEIAYHSEEQKKIQAEIDRVLAKHNHKLSYDAVKEMHYLEWAFKEAMRLFPSVAVTVRTCRKKYTFQDLGVTIEPGTRVDISIQALHLDPQYWDRPEEFRPARFSPESNEPKHKYAYLPFGAGPRGCIGERLGMMQSMAGLAAILSLFDVTPAPTSVRRPLVDPRSNIVQGFKGGLPVIFTPRKLQIVEPLQNS